MLKTVSSITNAIGAVNYKGTWNASTNTPNLSTLAAEKGDYYVVSVAGSTSLGGISTWYVGDWAVYNGAAWQRVEGGSDDPAPSVRSNSTTGVLEVTGPGAGTTRVMTTPDANFTAARTDAAQTFTGDQTFSGDVLLNGGPAPAETTAGQIAGNELLILGKAANVVANGTLDLTINTDTLFGNPAGFVGILNVSTTRLNFVVQSTRTVYAVAAYGTTLDITSLETQNGSGGASSFTITMPSNGVVRFTDTSGQDVIVRLSFIGSKSAA